MKPNLLIPAVAVVVLLAGSCATSPNPAPSTPAPAATTMAPASTENVELVIRQLIAERDQAIQKGDTAFLEGLYAADYTSTSNVGMVRTKAQVMDDFKSGVLKVDSIVSDQTEIRVHGDAAIVTGRSTIKGKDKGRDMSGQSRFTQVYVRKNGRWQIVAFHLSPVAQ